MIAEALKSRENSVAEPAPEAVAAANVAFEQAEPTAAAPAPVEAQGRESEEQEAHTAAQVASEAHEEKAKGIHGWRRSIGWMPHP